MSMEAAARSILQILIVALMLWGTKKTDNTAFFMSKEYTKVLKAVSCFCVMEAHMEGGIKYHFFGCFHFIGVFFFFLISGYGLTYSFKNKDNYLQGFYHRILTVALPYIIINLFGLFVPWIRFGSGGTFFVNVMLLFYVLFYITHKIFKKYADCMLCLLIILYSVSAQIFCD